MTNVYRALLIDPTERRIDVIATMATTAELLSITGADALGFFGIANYANSFDQGVADDVGLMKRAPVDAFRFDNRDDPIAGRCLVIGARKDGGETCDARMTVEFLEQNIVWLGRIKPSVRWESTDTGMRSVVSYVAAPL